MYPLVRELAATDAPLRVPVVVTCRVLRLARQPYYRWLREPVGASEIVRAYRADALLTPTGRTRSSAIASSSMRPARPARR